MIGYTESGVEIDLSGEYETNFNGFFDLFSIFISLLLFSLFSQIILRQYTISKRTTV